jgi:hypothetical protein
MVEVTEIEKKLSRLIRHIFLRYCVTTDPYQQRQKGLPLEAIRVCVSDMSAFFPNVQGTLVEELLQQSNRTYGLPEFRSFFENLLEAEFEILSQPPSAFVRFLATIVDKLFVHFVVYKPVVYEPSHTGRLFRHGDTQEHMALSQRAEKSATARVRTQEDGKLLKQHHHGITREGGGDSVLALCATNPSTNRYYEQALTALPNNKALLTSFQFYKHATDHENQESKKFTRHSSRAKPLHHLLSPADQLERCVQTKPRRPISTRASADPPFEVGSMQDDLRKLKYECLDADLATKVRKMQEYLARKKLRSRKEVDFVDSIILPIRRTDIRPSRPVKPRRKETKKLLGRGRSIRAKAKPAWSAVAAVGVQEEATTPLEE